MNNKPALPSWLHFAESKYKAIAYLYGTPIGNENDYVLEVSLIRPVVFDYWGYKRNSFVEERK